MSHLPRPPRRVLVAAPAVADGACEEGAPAPLPEALALMTALAADPGFVPQLLTAIPHGHPGLHRPAGTLLAGRPGRPGETLLLVPNFAAETGLQRSWYLVRRLREFLAARRFDLLCLFPGPPLGHDFVALARHAWPPLRVTAIGIPGGEGTEAAATGATDRIVRAALGQDIGRWVSLPGPAAAAGEAVWGDAARADGMPGLIPALPAAGMPREVAG
jgi:hypothetical protein